MLNVGERGLAPISRNETPAVEDWKKSRTGWRGNTASPVRRGVAASTPGCAGPAGVTTRMGCSPGAVEMTLSCARAVTGQLNKIQDMKGTAARMRRPTVAQNARITAENLPTVS